MQHKHARPDAAKGWYAGPWDGSAPIPIGYANAGIDDPHVHSRMTEVYLMACGTADVRIERETIRVEAGDVLVVEPGEPIHSSPTRPAISILWCRRRACRKMKSARSVVQFRDHDSTCR